MAKGKTHWTCMNFARKKASPECVEKTKGGPYDIPKGWKAAITPKRILAKCAACAAYEVQKAQA